MQKCFILFFFVFISCNQLVQAQKIEPFSKTKIAIFVPLYLDSAFDASDHYRYDSIFPKFINPGLEFYEGIQLAIDSLSRENIPFEVFVFDTRSKQKTIAQQLTNSVLKDLQLIIAHASISESQQIATVAKSKQIPFINVNLPNDANVSNNPWFVLLNPSLKTHVEGICTFIKKEFPTKTILVFRKKGQTEELISSYLANYNQLKTDGILKFKFVDLSEKYTIENITKQLDSNGQNICLVASLDDFFSQHLTFQLASISDLYPLTVFGMPTFHSFSKEFVASGFKTMTLYYGQPFYFDKSNSLIQSITNQFQLSMYARPSDMIFRGFEVMLKYAYLLRQYKTDLSSHLTTSNFNVFTNFDIHPVVNRKTLVLDYFENKKIYFIKWQDGNINAVY
ncbi:MAG: hypothetical protein EPO57_03020 [Chitinophagaceae bacterium]|nr:MAG: hypothetical protein EPO57_03020 [Chitinophagaceae bacterium]